MATKDIQDNYVVNPYQFIGRREETEALYVAEDKATQGIHDAAIQLGLLFGWLTTGKWDDVGYWQRSLPQALFSMLNHYGHATSVAAAKTYLEQHGYTVTKA